MATKTSSPSVLSATPQPDPAAPAVRFQAVRSARAFEEIADQIRTELAEGRLKVGSRLPAERALAVQFGVSRNTLREALRSLEHAGLVRLQKGASGGAFISEGSGLAITTSLMDLYHIGTITPGHLTEARIWLESVIVREACSRATPADLDALRKNVEAAAQATKDGDFQRRAEMHLDFHRILARMTGNPLMVLMMDSLIAVLSRFIQTLGEYENAFVLPSRKRFLKHMEARDVDAAVAEMEASLKRLQKGYLSHLATDEVAAAPAARSRAPAKKR
ncbi:FadR/GntR family transcriptional regulator [Pseudacidovorax intermedius]|uniref:FadR/GntR family transcriptional regulator n=1 Tax=Pseudacidovorax intermedius TaxID=433924 RepID=UPI00034DC208|nr:FadR/GntR family transcriptional regulator [Pseudacidovorax intermedius]